MTNNRFETQKNYIKELQKELDREQRKIAYIEELKEKAEAELRAEYPQEFIEQRQEEEIENGPEVDYYEKGNGK